MPSTNDKDAIEKLNGVYPSPCHRQMMGIFITVENGPTGLLDLALCEFKTPPKRLFSDECTIADCKFLADSPPVETLTMNGLD